MVISRFKDIIKKAKMKALGRNLKEEDLMWHVVTVDSVKYADNKDYMCYITIPGFCGGIVIASNAIDHRHTMVRSKSD